MYIPITIYFLT